VWLQFFALVLATALGINKIAQWLCFARGLTSTSLYVVSMSTVGWVC
jgi:hypothetical protein